ncbi:hypothetical protein GAPWKB30_0530 [Gilliamella apicola]|nr:hypothetical protein GAPWKB30_0530 [Gilliamella apicola]
MLSSNFQFKNDELNGVDIRTDASNFTTVLAISREILSH